MNSHLYYELSGLPTDLPPLSLVIGVLDGVHRGHQALLEAAGTVAPVLSAAPATLVLYPHPAAVLAPDHVPPQLTTLHRRAELLHRHGAEHVVVARFDHAFAALTSGEFVEEILVRKLRARAVVVGEDFRFGRGREGGIADLRAAGEQHGFRVVVVPPVLVEGEPARSSRIRDLLQAGVVEQAALLLGRDFVLDGVVARGRQMGRELGFPTANLAPPSELLIPGAGVYGGRMLVRGSWWRAAISVGTNPTVVEDGAPTVEAYLLDGFSEEIYGHAASLEFRTFLRPEERFEGIEPLIAQMRRDVAEVEKRIPLSDR